MPNKRELVILIGLFGFANLCYFSIIPTYFLSDDFYLIGKVAVQGLFGTWGTDHGGFLRPGTVLSYLVDHQIWGLNPIGYHLTNIIFHGITGYAVFFIGRHLFDTVGSTKPAFAAVMAACLFLALPSHSESVSWIAGRTDVIATAFGLTATICFLLLIQKRSLLTAFLSIALLAAALLTKESVIVLPAIWCALFVHGWFCAKERPSDYSAIVLILSWLCLISYFFLRKAFIGHFVGGYGTEAHIALMRMTSVTNLLRYMLRTFLPALPLRFYDLNQPFFLLAAGFAAGAFSSAFVFRWRRVGAIQWSFVALLGMCYLVSLIPVLTMQVNIFDTQGERFLYLPSAFACLLLVYLAAILIPYIRACAIILLVVIAAEAAALQWVNSRWITASEISQEIASEISKTDPAKTLVLNVPDNFRGAYVFRNGLAEAATIFMSARNRVQYRSICRHGMNSVSDMFDVSTIGSSVTLVLPNGIQFHDIIEYEFDVHREGGTLVVRDIATFEPEIQFLLSFGSAKERPMLRTIRWRATTDRPSIAPSAASHP